MRDQPDPHGPAPEPAERTVPCAKCGYNIRGRKIGDPCPECGTMIGQYPVENEGTQGKAVAALVLGIVSIVTCVMYGLPAVICGPLALMYAKKARIAVMQGESPRSSLGMAKAGRICGLIGTILGGVYLAFIVIYFVFIIGVFGFAIWQGGAGGGPAPAPVPVP